jgi:3-deoxy-D-manno-octulosonic-acid transferase
MFLYSVFTKIYFLFITIAASFNTRAKKYVKGRKGLMKKIKKALAKNHSPIAWFHCASLGEFEQARPVIEEFRYTFPDYKIFLTFFSPSGYEVRKKYESADFIFYLPNDSAANAKKLIKMMKPSVALFVKYEFWYHYLRELNKRAIPVISFSAIFRENQLFFKAYGRIYRSVLKLFSHLFVQNQHSYDLLSGIGIYNVSVSGDTRFDRVYSICKHPQVIPKAEKFKNNEKVIVMGSVWPSDMEVLFPLINSDKLKIKYIIAPHNIHENEILAIEENIKKPTVRFSKADVNTIQDFQVLIIDNIGMLSSLYQYGEFAYIGGAFNKGLHNTLEAATFGMPLFFGADETNRKFNEAIELEKAGAAFPIKTSGEIGKLLCMLLENEPERQEIAKIAGNYVSSRIGATDQIMNYVKMMIKND